MKERVMVGAADHVPRVEACDSVRGLCLDCFHYELDPNTVAGTSALTKVSSADP